MKRTENTILLPRKVSHIISTLENAGYEAYAVGGCVRDSILGRIPDDWDITTSALPNQVKALFQKTVDTGLQHGTVTVLLAGEGFEVTTYRIDGEYEDARHPKEVLFTPNLTEDLKRRDFTINAMAYNNREGLVDYFGGRDDLEKKIIRCVGQAKERFAEDALRIMRAVRFSAQLGYTIEEKTLDAICKLAPTLSKISAERIQVEITKLLCSNNPHFLKIAYEAGITNVILPEFNKMMETTQNNPHHCYNVGEHTLEALKAIQAEKVLRLTMLLHDSGKPYTKTTDENGKDHFYGHAVKSEDITKEILQRLRFDNKTIQLVTKLVFYHDYNISPTTKSVRKAIYKIGEEAFPLLLLVKEADMKAQSDYQKDEKREKLDAVIKSYQSVCEAKECVSLKTLQVSGKDLMGMGIGPGKQIGETLNFLLEAVIEEPDKNKKPILMALAKKFQEK